MVTQQRPSNAGGIIGGSVLIGLGVLFLLAQFFNFSAWQFIWPFFVIGVGGLFFIGMFLGGKPAAPLAIPGSIIGVIGLTLLYQNFSGHWNSWAYGWTIIVMAVGLGLWISGVWADNQTQRRNGWRVMRTGLVLFILFGAFFELIFSGFGGPLLTQSLFPVLLILLGLYLVIGRLGSRSNQAITPSTPVDVNTHSTPPSEPPQA
jgi:hypothetical protein